MDYFVVYSMADVKNQLLVRESLRPVDPSAGDAREGEGDGVCVRCACACACAPSPSNYVTQAGYVTVNASHVTGSDSHVTGYI